MSYSGRWDEDQGCSRLHQRGRRTSMQPAKMSGDCVSLSQPPEQEDKSSQTKIANGMLVPRALRGLVAVLGGLTLAPLLAFSLWEKVMPPLPVQLLLLMLLAVLTLKRIMNLWRTRMRRHSGRLVKWEPHEWVLDSGAWNHHTSNQELLLEGGDFQSQEMDNKDAPSNGDDAGALHARGRRGSVRTGCFDFPGVDYVAGDDTRNVVSVSQLARDHGLVTVFEPTSCHVKEKKNGKIVGKGRLRNGMYILDSLRIIGQHIRDGGSSGGDHHDRADGGGGGNGDGDSTAEGRGRDDRGGGGGGTGARNLEEGGGSGATEGDNGINEEEEGCDEKEIEEINENDEDDIKEIGEANGKGEKEDDEKRGEQNSGQLSSHTGLFAMSRSDCIWGIVSILCIAACILEPYTGWGTRVKILPVNVFNLVGFFLVLFIVDFKLFKTVMNAICKEEQTLGPYLQELSHQEHNRRLFGLSRFDESTDSTGYQLPAGAFPASSTNAPRREEFLVDSGASFHATWKESVLFPYPQHLQDHTKPPTRRFGGIVGSIVVTRSGYLNGDKIMLDGVLLALESRMNLVSVGQLSIQYGVQVEMDDKEVIIKNKWDGVQVGGGKMLNNHQYVLEHFQPEGGLFAHHDTPHPKVFGRRRPGPV